MPLYIRDDSVDALAGQLVKLTGAKSKTDAVRGALIAQIEAMRSRKSLLERLKPLQDRTAALGPVDPDFDMKRYMDEMWGEA
ncbi:MAG: type II toxin-antitoxin system VapB family antitoxin [Rhodobacteraceae bacterium]|nr:type II toxin-antitoxin system VapB family antitoxin [Paracoccaceae bacterium]